MSAARLLVLLSLFLLPACVQGGRAVLPDALSLGASADGEVCNAGRRLDTDIAAGAARYDVFCGTWRRPAATLDVYPADVTPDGSLLSDCALSAEPALAAQGVQSCPGRLSGTLLRDVAVTSEGPEFYVEGRGIPGVLPALRRGTATLAGLEDPVALSAEELANLPGVVALQDQEVLRRRGHRRNVSFRFSLAAEDYAKAVTIQDGLFGGDPVRRADIALDLALNLSSQGRFAEAEQLLEDTAGAAGVQTTAWLRDKLINYQAVHKLNKGAYREALDLAEQPFSPETFGEFGFVSDVSGAGIITPRAAEFVNHRTGNSVPPIYSDAELRPGVRAIILEAHRSYLRASALNLLGREGGGEALDDAARQVSAAPDGSAAWLEALIDERRADNDLEAGNVSAARSRLSSLVARWTREQPQSLLTARLLSSLGRAQLADGDLEAALVSFNRAFDLYSGVEGSFGISPDVAGNYLAALLKARDAGLGNEADLTRRFVEAFEGMVEPQAATAMAQAAARIADDGTAEEIRALQDAERALQAARLTLQQEASTADPERRDLLAAQVDAAEQAVLDAELVARQAQPQYMQLVNGGADTGDLLATLGNKEAFVAFSATRAGGFGYAAFKGRIVPFGTSLDKEAAARLVRRLRASLRVRGGQVPPFAAAQAHDLFEGIFGPVHADLKEAGIETLVFAPRGVIGSLPPSLLLTSFDETDDEAARDGRYRALSWLATDFAFINTPSAASYVAARSASEPEGTRGMTVFGPPVPPSNQAGWVADFTERMVAEGRPARCGQVFAGQPNLQAPLTPLARSVGASWGRRDISGRAFTDLDLIGDETLAGQQVLVFVTHGFFGDGFCITEPALLTSLDRKGGDGMLSATEILDLKLEATLVVLAACDTARAAEGAEGVAAAFDGAQLDGLVRSFVYAGARSVMATHWVADDAAADAIVRQFFKEAAGTPMHEALRSAQLALIGKQRTAHPYFWAPYVMIGDAGRTLARR
ncbi:MAG: CHAT domain-containing tetratricopeptide repeat protein [Parvibaculaceae bacterium]